MTGGQFRKLALALEDVSEKPHFDRAAFRTTQRIFATMSSDEREVNFMLDPELQKVVMAAQPDAFFPVKGKWGEGGATTCVLKKVKLPVLKQTLGYAHQRAR